jgi:molybdopterin biosynthesis enzyme
MSAAGQFVRRGQVVVPKGTVIGPGQISALTTIGKDKIKVFRRPVVAIICTGDELVSAGRPLRPGKTYNSNGPALVAEVTHHGGIAKVLGIARDNEDSVERKIQRGMIADTILISGGVSKRKTKGPSSRLGAVRIADTSRTLIFGQEAGGSSCSEGDEL